MLGIMKTELAQCFRFCSRWKFSKTITTILLEQCLIIIHC